MDRHALIGFSLSAALLVPAAAPPARAAGLGQARVAEFRETPELPLDFEKAWQAVRAAIEPYGISQSDPARGEVVSEYVLEEVHPNRYRTRVHGVVQRRGERTVVAVRAQREVLMEALTPATFGSAPRWQKVGTNRRVSDAILDAVLKTAGITRPAATAATASGAAARGPQSASAPLPPAWDEIQKLKGERATLMAPIKELDRRALEILYSDDAAQRSKELQSVKEQRTRLWEGVKVRVMEIDRRILELALQE